METMYNINYSKLRRLLLPALLQKGRLVAWLKCLVEPIGRLRDVFETARDKDLLWESIDSSIPRLEYLLNHTFYKPGLKEAYRYRIVIDYLPQENSTPIFLGGVMQPTDEDGPVMLGTKSIYTAGETGEVKVDFVVKVPAHVNYNQPYMEALIRSFALPDKQFRIEAY